MFCPKHLNYIRNINNGYINVKNSNLSCSAMRQYSKNKDDCCKYIPQTEGQKVEPWPKEAPVTCHWRKECPTEPQPPNYDPYRIKVPNVVVPPPPPINVKCPAVVFSNPWSGQEPGNKQQEYTNQQKEEQPEIKQQEQGEENEPLGFFGYLKSLFGGGKGKTKGDGEDIPEEDIENIELNKDSTSYHGNMHNEMQNLFAVVHSHNWKKGINCGILLGDKQETVFSVKLGYHGKTKYKYAFHEPWNPLDRMTLLQEAEEDEINVSPNIFVTKK